MQVLLLVDTDMDTAGQTLCVLRSRRCCLISLFYIKPQRSARSQKLHIVVLYLFSTSNHNNKFSSVVAVTVVLYLFSTSNHNFTEASLWSPSVVLYLFSTSNHNLAPLRPSLRHGCLISLFYIKPQLTCCNNRKSVSCLISLFYIKPQPTYFSSIKKESCLISLFYIKPQHTDELQEEGTVVLYLFSTSNHNSSVCTSSSTPLSYISFLHQTTTVDITNS